MTAVRLHGIVWMIYIVLIPRTYSQVTLSSSFNVSKKACPRESITYNCTVLGSRTLSWSSNEYIGMGGVQLEFSTLNRIGDKLTSQTNPNVSAILTNVTDDGGMILLQSELFIMASEGSTVSCLTANAGSRRSIELNVLSDQPGMPQDPAAVEIPSPLVDQCILLIDWDHPANIDSSDVDYYIVHNSHESKLLPTIDDSYTLYTFLSPCSELSNLTINVTAVDNCGQVGVTSNNFSPQIVKRNTEAPHTTGPNTVTPSIEYRSNEAVTIVFSIILVIVMIMVILTILLVYIIFQRRLLKSVAPGSRNDSEIDQLVDAKIEEKMQKYQATAPRL